MEDSKLKEELESYNNKSSKKIYIWVILILLLGSSAYYFFILKNSTQTQTFEYVTKKITRGDLSVVVSATGNLNPTNSVDIGIEVSGTIKEIYVDFNDEVEIGQVLAKLDTTKLQSEVDSLRASLTIAKANQKESEVGLRSKKSIYDRTLKMYKSSNGKYPSINELDDTKFTYETAISNLDATKAKVEQAI